MPALDLKCLWQDNSKAARLLAEHGHVTAAVKRLMQPLHQAAKAGRPVNPTWADKETLSLLYTYCTSLNSEWALQQVPSGPEQSCRLVLLLPCLHGVCMRPSWPAICLSVAQRHHGNPLPAVHCSQGSCSK